MESNADAKNSSKRFLKVIRGSARVVNFHTPLKGLFDETDLAFDDMHGQYIGDTGQGQFLSFSGALIIL